MGRGIDAAAAERVVGIRRGQRQLLLQGGHVDVRRAVLGLGGGIDDRGFPVEAAPFAAQAGQQAALPVLHPHLLEAGVDVAIVAHQHRQPFVGHVGQPGQAVRIRRAVGERHRTERIPVIAGRDPQAVEVDHRRLHRFADRAVVADFAERGDPGRQVVGAGQEQVQAFDRGPHRGIDAGVVAHVAVHGVEVVVAAGQAQPIAVGHRTAGAIERGRLDMELARTAGDEGAIGADPRARPHRQPRPRRVRGTAVQRVQPGEIGVLLEQGPEVVGFGEVLVRGPQRRTVGVVEEQRDVAVVVGVAGERVDFPLVHARAFRRAVTGAEGDAVEVAAQHGIDHAGHRVGTVDRGRAVLQDLDALDRADGDRVQVLEALRAQRRALRERIGRQAAAVQQDQRAAEAEVADVQRARPIGEAVGHAIVDRIAGGRHELQDLVHRYGTGALDVLARDHVDGRRRLVVDALDVGAGDVDLDVLREHGRCGQQHSRGSDAHHVGERGRDLPALKCHGKPPELIVWRARYLASAHHVTRLYPPPTGAATKRNRFATLPGRICCNFANRDAAARATH